MGYFLIETDQLMKLSLHVRWGDPRPDFVPPLTAAVRTVVLGELFRPNSKMRFVDASSPGAVEEVRSFRPAVLAGSFKQLCALPAGAEVSHAVVIFTAEGAMCASEEDRDALWSRFHVPVFEQVLTADGRLAAWECEAHDGLHIADGADAAPGSEMEFAMCGCGAVSPRVVGAVMAPRFKAGTGGLLPLVQSRVAAA